MHTRGPIIDHSITCTLYTARPTPDPDPDVRHDIAVRRGSKVRLDIAVRWQSAAIEALQEASEGYLGCSCGARCNKYIIVLLAPRLAA